MAGRMGLETWNKFRKSIFKISIFVMPHSLCIMHFRKA